MCERLTDSEMLECNACSYPHPVCVGSAADGPGADCEVLRRDLGADLTRDCVKELRSSGQAGIPVPHTHVTPGE